MDIVFPIMHGSVAPLNSASRRTVFCIGYHGRPRDPARGVNFFDVSISEYDDSLEIEKSYNDRSIL